MTPGIRLRRMRWWDIEAAVELDRDLFDVEAWSAALFWAELAEHETRCYVVAEGDEASLVGYAGLATYADATYVQTLAVARDRWGTGVGGALLEALLAVAAARGASPVVLEVRADNERAQALYRRYGFVRVGLRRGYYQPSGADALVMVRHG
ncbi:MAG TPA: ribosomal protein S18-alanine N-acetyltransferase [Mycobacteriales bacterium]|nr:ribosomal protein S18-alanine N-acetyltransferase [Mycobacteriales bacterium]